MKKYPLYLLVAAFLSLFGCKGVETLDDNEVPPQPFYERAYVPGTLNIKVNEALAEKIENEGTIQEIPGVNAERLFLDGGQYEERMRREGLHLWYRVTFDENITLTKANNTLSSVEGVEYVEFCPHMVINDFSSPFDDPDFSKQWHYYNNGNARTGRIPGCDINVLPAWERGIVGSDKVIVAVIDEGVDFNHEDLHDNMWINPETEKVTYGYNFDAGSDFVVPGDHGTHVAGTISAVNNNGIGVNGIAGGDAAKGIRGVQIMSCQMFSPLAHGEGDFEGAIVWAANHGAVIAQNSWGLKKEYVEQLTEIPKAQKVAIDYFNKYAGCDNDGNQLADSPMKGGVVIFSAGNESMDKGFPASYEGCIAVAAVAGDFTPAYYTNFGDWVDIAAPGGDSMKGQEITSTLTDNGYGRMQGTSMACPHVSGVAALIVSEFGGPGFTREMCIDRLLNTVTPLREDYKVGRGIVNAADAVAHYGEFLPNNAEFAGYETESATSLELNFIVPAVNNDVKCRSLNVYISDKEFSQPADAVCRTVNLASLSTGDTVSVSFDKLGMDTEYFVSTIGVDAMGNESPMSKNVSVMTRSNLPPVIEALNGTEVTMKRFLTKTLEFKIYDPDKNLKDVNYSAASKADTFAEKDGKYILTITGPEAEPGDYTSTIKAMDDLGETVSVDIHFVIEKNQAPMVKGIENQIIIGAQQSIELKLSDYFSHPDGDELTYTATVSGDPVVSTNVMNASQKMTIRSNSLGYNDITVTATDTFGLTAQSTFKVAAMAGNGYEAYPNPVTDGKLYIRSAREGSFQLSLVNSSGATVRNESVNNDPFAPYCLNVSDLAAGRYTVKVKGSGESTSQTIVIF